MKKKDLTKKQKILDATVEIIIRDGSAAISTTKVAKKVGISQSNIYLYFKDKRALLDGVYLREIARLEQTPEMKIVLNPDEDIRIRCFTYLKSMYDFSLQNPHSLYVLEQIKLLSKGAPDYLSHLVGSNNPIEELFNAGIKAGVLRKIDRRLTMTVIFSVIEKHTENLQNGVYTESDVPFETVSQMIWAALAIVPYPFKCQIKLEILAAHQ